ncbi:hypothetical protein BBJ28_00018373 [Nothophytophthora sp. Chile5]|nr:hypothetical protein BBJ28_00018373 [Nothophytophthora sp. Chile5]
MASSSKPSASGGKVKTSTAKKSRRSDSADTGKATRGEEKVRRSKDKDRKNSTKKTKPAAAAPAAASTSAEPVVHDPDAIQLFRRYDRGRTGVLTRLDFLQLLRDYANPAGLGAGRPGGSPSRTPLSLTDSSGIPLGYERADRNSEFEAGQLFERYDKNRSGALTLDGFHVFFADFKTHLRAFVEDCNYGALAPPAASAVPAPLHPVQEKPAPTASKQSNDAAVGDDENQASLKAIRAQYRRVLWKLRKICKDELFDQREHIVHLMKAMREEMATRQRTNSSRSRHSVRWSDTITSKRRSRAMPFPDFDDDEGDDGNERGGNAERDAAKRYEAMEDDLDRLDELFVLSLTYLVSIEYAGNDATRHEMQEFLAQADSLQEEARSLAMKDYDETDQRTPRKTREDAPVAPPPAPASAPALSSSSSTQHYQSKTDLENLLRVKDQMIYQLLQERTTMRRERAAVESSLKKLSEVSTHEMKKWARLTDDMQAEIEQLRSQLRSRSQQRNTMP